MKKKHIVFVSLGIFLAWALSAILIVLFIDEDFRGAAGDMFGAVNALFSGFAFAGLIYTISVQRQELKEQKRAIEMQTEELSLQRKAIEMQTEELRMQREEAARSADQLEIQQGLMSFQIVMTTINELIKIKNKRIELIGFLSDDKDFKGVKALSKMVINNRERNIPFTKDQEVLQNYFNSFFYILQYIVNSDLDLEKKKVLGKMLDMDTSDAEIYILYSAFFDDQYRLSLLNQFFNERYKKNSDLILRSSI
ncbi:hypothetical protein [Paenibacillus senegalimassiliensis]|uniref:hypothetical protein n=1 Tax=Paenibacillus senegalimassiliensis TaxID=1737426 RepID=UPI00073F3AFE|nr:hypothetical protein [Paenibacillus senegalimassiliensis]